MGYKTFFLLEITLVYLFYPRVVWLSQKSNPSKAFIVGMITSMSLWSATRILSIRVPTSITWFKCVFKLISPINTAKINYEPCRDLEDTLSIEPNHYTK